MKLSEAAEVGEDSDDRDNIDAQKADGYKHAP